MSANRSAFRHGLPAYPRGAPLPCPNGQIWRPSWMRGRARLAWLWRLDRSPFSRRLTR